MSWEMEGRGRESVSVSVWGRISNTWCVVGLRGASWKRLEKRGRKGVMERV